MYDIKVLEVEIEKYFGILNIQLGVFLFTISMACIAMNNPFKASLVALIMIVPLFFWVVKNYFPPTIDTLRKLCKEYPDDTELEELLSSTEERYFSFFKVTSSTFIFWVGFIFYIAVLFYPEFPIWVKS